MAIYDFTFAPEYAGQTATVTDSTGAEVTGSPVTLDEHGAAQLTLPAASDYAYTAATSNETLGLGTAHATGTLDFEDSLNAAGGGALPIPTTYVQLECNAGGTLDDAAIPFDTFYAGGEVVEGQFTIDGDTGTVLGLDPGTYVGFFQTDFETPDKDYVVTARWSGKPLAGSDIPEFLSGGYLVSAAATTGGARSPNVPMTLIVETDGAVFVGFTNQQSLTADDTVTPATYSYAYVNLVKIG